MSSGKASIICWPVQNAVGLAVTLKCTTRRRSCERTTNTYRMRKLIVGTVKKSNATKSLA